MAHVADRRDVDRQRARRPGDVAAGEDHPGLVGHPGEAVEQAVDVGDRQPVGEDQREQGQAGRAAHRGDVADVDRERLVADVGERGEPQVEVDALDERVGRQDLAVLP